MYQPRVADIIQGWLLPCKAARICKEPTLSIDWIQIAMEFKKPT